MRREVEEAIMKSYAYFQEVIDYDDEALRQQVAGPEEQQSEEGIEFEMEDEGDDIFEESGVEDGADDEQRNEEEKAGEGDADSALFMANAEDENAHVESGAQDDDDF